MSEANDLTNFILEYFLKKKIFAVRHGVAAGVSHGANGKKYFVRGGILGGHDIFVWIPNYRFLGIEIKIGKDKLRPEQEGFHKNIVTMGHLSWVVRSREDFLEKANLLLNRI